MTKKDYIKFADMIAELKKDSLDRQNAWGYHTEEDTAYNNGCIDMLDDTKQHMLRLFESDNPNFDASRFNNYIENKVKQILDSVQ